MPAGQGDGQVRQTLAALRDSGFDGFVSLEPHLAQAGRFGGFSGPEGFTRAARGAETDPERTGDPLPLNLACLPRAGVRRPARCRAGMFGGGSRGYAALPTPACRAGLWRCPCRLHHRRQPRDLAAELGQQLRVDSIRSSTSAGSGHPTSSMSAADLLAVLVSRHLRYNWDKPDQPG